MMNDDEIIEELMREIQPPRIKRKGSKKRLFRCTFYEKSAGLHAESTIVVEFFAPFPIDERLDYEKMAKEQLLSDLSSNHYFAIRDLEPVELK